MQRDRILIVEDDPGLVEGIRTILEIDQYDVLTANNGEQALELMHQTASPPDLIVSDIMMPRMDGLQFLRQVRQKPEWVSIPVIFLTARGDRADIQQGKRLGVDDYLIKPFEAEDLLVAVESRLKRRRALDNAHNDNVNDLKRSILTILNHEFRTPLTFIVAYADMIANHDRSIPDEELLTFLKGVGTGAVRLRQLIENFIMLVELETGDARRTFEWRRSTITDTEAMLRDVRDKAMQLEPFPHSCVYDIDPDLPPFVGDREFIMVALGQLLNNAVKFSPPDRPITLGAHRRDESVCLSVSDRGRGIPPEQIESIWETFYQIDRPIHEDRGTGSGLSIVRGIVEMHRGKVDVTSTVGHGTTVTLRLPLNLPLPD